MKKFLLSFVSLFFLLVISTLIILSTIGIETNRFNNFISNKINKSNKNFFVELNDINFKIDIKEISLFLETLNPKLLYRNTALPVKSVKVYIDFFSILKTDGKINKINLSFNQINTYELKKISSVFKPSNLTSFLNNNVKGGKINGEIDIFLNENNLFDNFITRGSVSNLDTKISKDLIIKNTSFNFFADKSDILLRNISSKNEIFKVEKGDLKIKLDPKINLTANFKTHIKFTENKKKVLTLIKKIKHLQNLKSIEAKLNSNFDVSFDKTYKIERYNYISSGEIINANLNINKLVKNSYLEEINPEMYIQNSKFNSKISLNKNSFSLEGKYSLDKDRFQKFNFESYKSGKNLNLKFDLDYDELLNFQIINYKKPKNQLANISATFLKKDDFVQIKDLMYKENQNKISIKDLKIKNNQFLSLKELTVYTKDKNEKNNDFNIKFGKNIIINGSHYDARNLSKFLNQTNQSKRYSQINNDIEINFSNIIAPLSEKLKNFKLIGKIEKGRFKKITSKGDFGRNNYLDISMKNDEIRNKQYLEIYSDLSKPLLAEYNFFKGLTGGKLLYTSVIEKNLSISNLKIENFKVINAPGMVKLLTLADLGGLADLAEGEGISFDILEIQLEKNGDNLKFNEILALGPSISVLMDGYQNSKITSLRGTLVPAKTLNKVISKIPIIGDIIIPKEAGEGLFGISFKMKGPPGQIKTSINPIRTITPRFIQKIIDKSKKTK